MHEGHIKLLQRAKALGDYLIVGVTNDNFDRQRGKLNVRRTVLERVAAVQALGIADKIVIEDYVGQKIDDVQKYEVDIFAIGSDWTGAFDFLKEYCQVVYLPRTEGISSTILRAETQPNLRIGVVGCGRIASRFISESSYVEAVEIKSFYDLDQSVANAFAKRVPSAKIAVSYEALLSEVDAVYIATPHVCHYQQCKDALLACKHVLCETPLVLNGQEARELYALAQERFLVLLEANKTAFCPAFNHLIVLIKTGAIGDVVGIDASESKLWDRNKLKRELDYNQGGGAQGIGLSIATQLASREDIETVYIVDKAVISPDYTLPKFQYHCFDLTQDDYSIFDQFLDADVLMITAGLGKLALFEDLDEFHIVNLLQVNTVATIRIIHRFYSKIRSSEDFYCGVMVSIAGFLSSPLFSVYGASKAALKIFIESVNIELERSGSSNRILNVSPGSIRGTAFNGGPGTDLTLTSGLAEEIVSHLYAKDDLFIPQYEEVYKEVLRRYQEDFRKEGSHSYDYKLKSGRMK